jgi:hypothetical protein
MNLKSIVMGGVIPFISVLSPEAGKCIADGQAALEDGKLSETEAIGLANDAIDTAESFWPAGKDALESLRQNINEDIQAEEKIVQDVERTFSLFKAIGQPAGA